MIEPKTSNQEFVRLPKITRLSTKVSLRESLGEIQSERHRRDRELDKIADLYVVAEGNTETLTLANDLLLRLFLRLDLDITASQVFFDELKKRIGAKEDARGRHGEEQRERERADTIKQSIKQLADFIKSERAIHPEVIFASSPELDEIKGIDLLKCRPVWDNQAQKLILDIELIQAKSGVMDSEEIRNLGRVYQSNMRRVEREFVLSKRWFQSMAKEVIPPVPEYSNEQLFNHLVDQRALIDLLTPADPDEDFAAFKNFHQAAVIYEQMDKIFKDFGVPNTYQFPDIELRSLKFFLLVNTGRGSKYLEVNQAVKY